MVGVEVSALDLTVQAGLLAVLFGLVVLLALFEETVRSVVMRDVLGGFEWVRSGGWRVGRGAVACVKLFENLAASF